MWTMQVRLATTLPMTAAEAWALVRTSALLKQVAAPLVQFRPLAPAAFPAAWAAGEYRVRAYLFGLVPLGWQVIRISFPDDGPARHLVRDDGYGLLARRWDHLIMIEPAGDRTCRYEDDVEIAAGALTPFVWTFARVFYAHRQRRWQALARDARLRSRMTTETVA